MIYLKYEVYTDSPIPWASANVWLLIHSEKLSSVPTSPSLIVVSCVSKVLRNPSTLMHAEKPGSVTVLSGIPVPKAWCFSQQMCILK